MEYLNLGCGSHFHPDWTNVNFTSTGEGVIVHNLRDGVPFDDESFDAVYHSHVLEHFTVEEGRFFIQECFRVLRPKGILRVVVPDLEKIAQLYLQFLEQALNGTPGGVDNYHWMLLEMYDQVVRNISGGEMANYLRQSSIPNKDFVIERVGQEAENIMQALSQASRMTQSSPKPLSEREALLKELLGDADYASLQIGRFRQQGEIHQWMYDRYSLSELLESNGFENVCSCEANESQIPEFHTFGLEKLSDGRIRKPDSLFMEACKLNPKNSFPLEKMTESRARALEMAPPKALSDLAVVRELRQQICSLQETVSCLDADLQRARKRVKRQRAQQIELEGTIADMEKSRFWQLRNAWFWLKAAIAHQLSSQLESPPASAPSASSPIESLTTSEISAIEGPAGLDAAQRQTTQSGDNRGYLLYLHQKIEPFTYINVSHIQTLVNCLHQLDHSVPGSVIHCGDLEAGVAAVLAHMLTHSLPHRALGLAPPPWLTSEVTEIPGLPGLLTALSIVNADMTKVTMLNTAPKYSLSGLANGCSPTSHWSKQTFGSMQSPELPLAPLSMLSINLENGVEEQHIAPLLEQFLDRLVDGGMIVLISCHKQEENWAKLDAYLSKHQMRYDAEQSNLVSVWIKTCQ